MRRTLWFWLILFGLSATGCHSLKVTDDVRPAQFAQALDGEVAVIHLQDGRTISAGTVYVEADSAHYIKALNQLAPKS